MIAHGVEAKREENTMNEEAKREEELLRNAMTLRWTDADFRLVADTAWRRRMSASELVRQLVIAGLKAEGQKEV